MEPLLRLENISKQFPGVKALDHMNFELYPGEVHILAGENGAGKSTLSKCILGYIQPDEGDIYVRGDKVRLQNPDQALQLGIGAVYQELTMIPWLNAAENIFFNREPVVKGTGLIRRGKMIRDARAILEDLGCKDLDVTLPVRKLGIARQQMIEIAKVLSMKPEILIFDEPTASLSEKEVDALFEKIQELKKQGVGMIYISHRLQEYERIGDRITVMRDGKFIGTGKIGQIPEKELIHMMVGRDVDQAYVRTGASRQEEILRVSGLSDRKGRVKDCSITINRGEIVGLAGLVGSGRTEFARLLYGIDRPGKGKVLLSGKDVTGKLPGRIVESGMGLLPEDRKGQGLALRAPVSWNISSVSLDKLFSRHRVRPVREKEEAEKYIKDLDIAVPGPETAAGSLSGGNQQKVVIGKWLCADTDLLIFDEPTRGIDVGAKMEICQLMDRMAAQGKAVLMISSELPEIMGMSDRIYVMRDGRITGELSRDQFSRETIGALMLTDREGESS